MRAQQQTGADRGSGSCDFELERRPQQTPAMTVLSPVLAIALALVTFFLAFAADADRPVPARSIVYFIDPLTALWSIEDLTMKALRSF